MAHAIYQTSAIILTTKNMRESNKLIVLYTEKFGLIYCVMQSVRELKSKMRYHSNRYSLVTVDLVQGRDIWRIIGIHEDISALTFAGSLWYELIVKFSALIIRLSSSEEAHDELWQNFEYLYRNKDSINDENQEYYEIIFTMRTLSVLGYWDGRESLLQSLEYKDEFFDYVQKNKNTIIQTINQRLHESQL